MPEEQQQQQQQQQQQNELIFKLGRFLRTVRAIEIRKVLNMRLN